MINILDDQKKFQPEVIPTSSSGLFARADL